MTRGGSARSRIGAGPTGSPVRGCASSSGTSLNPGRVLAHEVGLPSVRTILTRFCSRRSRSEFGSREQTINDHVVAANAIVHELRGVALGADDESGGISP